MLLSTLFYLVWAVATISDSIKEYNKRHDKILIIKIIILICFHIIGILYSFIIKFNLPGANYASREEKIMAIAYLFCIVAYIVVWLLVKKRSGKQDK